MKNKISKYPVGATWRGTNEDGMTGEITLISRNEYFEVWRWYKKYSDGSMPKLNQGSDWSTNYRKCRLDMNLYNRSTGEAVRLKRIK